MTATRTQPRILSMTGFSSVEGDLAGTRVRMEMKALNHRFLELKIRLPRELSSAEVSLRAALQGRFARGAIDVKVERLNSADEPAPAVQVNLALAANYYESLVNVQRTLGLSDPIRTIDVVTLPEVMNRGARDEGVPDAWTSLAPIAQAAATRLEEMRAIEGAALEKLLRDALTELHETIDRLRAKRVSCEQAYRDRIQGKVKAVFDAHPLISSGEASIQTVLESRIAQELALLVDRTDIEEELARFKGHLDHFERILDSGGPVGRKLDFILQELHREINTLGNKAQDFSMSEDVVQVKVRLEQIREQVMNLE